VAAFQGIEIGRVQPQRTFQSQEEHHGGTARIVRQSKKMADFMYGNSEHLVVSEFGGGVEGDPALKVRSVGELRSSADAAARSCFVEQLG